LLKESNGGIIFWVNPHCLGVPISNWFFELSVNLRLLDTTKHI